jgi:hypothetical protein
MEPHWLLMEYTKWMEDMSVLQEYIYMTMEYGG